MPQISYKGFPFCHRVKVSELLGGNKVWNCAIGAVKDAASMVVSSPSRRSVMCLIIVAAVMVISRYCVGMKLAFLSLDSGFNLHYFSANSSQFVEVFLFWFIPG